jgi:hypothetical protein
VSGVFEAAVVVLLAAHLVLVNVAMMGPLFSVCLDWRSCRSGDADIQRAALTMARLATWGLTGGIALGLALLGIRYWFDDGAYLDAVSALPRSRLWFAGFELLFFFACMGAYTGLWHRWRRWRFAHSLLAVAAATNLLMHFPALFVIISVVDSRVELQSAPIDSAEFRRLLVDGEVLSRVVHVWLAAVVVTGAILMKLGLRFSGEEPSPGATRLIRGGALAALVACLLQVPVGFWVTLEMPEAARAPLMGGDLWSMGLFLASLGLALVLLQLLAAVALGDVDRKPIYRSLAALALLMVLMVATRTRADRFARGPEPAAVAQAILDARR